MVYFILAIEGNGQSSFPILGPANMQLPIFTIKWISPSSTHVESSSCKIPFLYTAYDAFIS